MPKLNKFGYKVSIMENNTCNNCIFGKIIKDSQDLHCSELPMAKDGKINLYQINRFREFTWTVELIPKESIIVPANFGCNNFKTKT